MSNFQFYGDWAKFFVFLNPRSVATDGVLLRRTSGLSGQGLTAVPYVDFDTGGDKFSLLGSFSYHSIEPFSTVAMASIFEGKNLWRKNGTNFAEEAGAAASLKGKVVAIYFSAHWCPPCRGFTPILKVKLLLSCSRAS